MSLQDQAFFNDGPEISYERSKFKRCFTHKTTFNAGFWIPFYVNLDIIPGTTIKNTTSMVVRLNTPKFPIMDNLYLDTAWFWVPWRQVWKNSVGFFGENELGAFAPAVEYVIPKFKTGEGHVNRINDINTYMGIRYNSQCQPWSQLGVRTYIRIWNYFMRPQEIVAPLTMDTSDGDITIDGTTLTGGTLLPSYRMHDYFSSATISAQRAVNPVSMPLGTTAPVSVYGNGRALNFGDGTSRGGVYIYPSNSNVHINTDAFNKNIGVTVDTSAASLASSKALGVVPSAAHSGLIGLADLSNATAATINALRLSFATQRILERQIFGTRYLQETLKTFWGIESDAGKGIVPEFLGSKRVPLNIETVLQNSSTDSTSPLGHTGAFSVTTDINVDFVKSFIEHGTLMGLLTVRADHTYQQGIARQWTRSRLLDTYLPQLAHIGNQPIYKYELFTDGSNDDLEVFGFKEAWAEYKFTPNRISGELLSDYATSLDSWHLGDDYSQHQAFTEDWLKEPYQNIDRCIAITSETHNQFIADIYVEQEVAMPMPLHCTPGLIDHF